MKLYGREYASLYDKMWIDNPVWKEEMNYIQSLIAQHVSADKKWLDAGCGTGFFLKKFKGFPRAGFDLSEGMLEEAKSGNEDCLFLNQHDISMPWAEWNNQWDFISCTGQPWCYLPSMQQIENVVKNIYDWLTVDGKCLLVPDDVQSAFKCSVNYNFDINSEAVVNKQIMNAIIHSFYDGYSNHQYMIYPLLDQWVRWFSVYFERIDIVSKKFDTHHIPRAYILCSKRRRMPERKNADVYVNNQPLAFFEKKYGKKNINNQTLFFSYKIVV